MEKGTVTKNRVPIYGYKSPGLHSFCICLYAKAGPLYESAKDSGISHFVEHIVFRNINRIYGGKLYDMLDELGLCFTAATYKEFMQFTVTGASRNFRRGAEIITKLFESLSNALCGEEFEAERDRIRAEIREYDEKATLEYLVKKKAWENTPIENMITGTLGTVGRITLARCEKERKRIFSQRNFFFYITGCFSDDDLWYLAECTEKYSFDKGDVRDNRCPLPEEFGKRSGGIIHKDSPYYMVELCFDLDMEKTRKETRNLFYDLIFSGENCRFFRELSEKLGYVYSYDAKIEEYGNVGNLSVSFELSYKKLYDGISAAIKLLRDIKTDASGLSRAKVYYTDNAELMLDNAEDFNWTMAYENHILGEKQTSLVERKRKYEAVTEKEISDMASLVFRRSNLIVGVKGRKKKIDDDKIVGLTELLD